MKVDVMEPLRVEMMAKIVFMVIAIALLLSGEGMLWHAQAAIPSAEREALIALYNRTDGDNWDNNSGWKDEPLDTAGFAMPGTENTWVGVSCDEGNTTVLEIDLWNNLNGAIPPELGNLTNLTELDLGLNQLTGDIPPELGSLTNLRELLFSSNQLSGAIPPELGSLTNLKYIHLRSNQLTGDIPPELGSLTNLTDLNLEINNLTGAIPPELGNLTNLRRLYLSSNQFTGIILPELGNLSRLTRLWLNDNELTGPIPTELMNLTNLYDSQSDFRYNHLYTSDIALRDFLNGKQIGGDWESYQTGPNVPPDQPVLSWPTDGLTGVSLTPALQTGSFLDPNPGDTHLQTEWEISKNSDFSSPVFYTISSTYLTSLPVPQLLLLKSSTYYWRIRFYDNHGNASDWSDTFSFTTMTTTNDLNSNGIPDDLENNTVDLDNDGNADIEQDNIKSLNTVAGGQMGVSREDDPTVVDIESIDSIDPFIISEIARPYSMPLGLFGIRLSVTNPGDTAQVVVYFSQAADPSATWLMYDPVKGWIDYSSYATFSPDRMSVTLELKDGDYGDADGVANGIIIDLGGFGLASWIAGRVYDASTGEGISQAEVSVQGLLLYTMENGDYLSMILPGIYEVSVSARGYVSIYDQSIEIPEDQTVTNDIALNSNLLYFPHSDTTYGWETEITIINTSSTHTATCTLKGYSDQGELIEAVPITLNPHARKEINISLEFTNHSSIRYLILNSNTDTLKGYTEFCRQGKYRAAIPAISDINTSGIYISHLDSSANWWTGISLLNTTSSQKELQITFNTGESIRYTLNANEHNAFAIRDLFGGQPQPYINSAKITNASGIMGLELFGSTEESGNKQLSGIPLKDDTTQIIYYPHIASDDTWWTGIVAYNSSSSTSTINITPYTDTGDPLTPQTQDIEPNGKYIGTAWELSLPPGTAWLKIDSANPITGFELFGTNDGNQMAGYTGVGISGKSRVCAKVDKDDWNNISFINTEESEASIILTAYDDSGAVIATQTITLNGYAKEIDEPGNIFTQDISSATYISYSSDRDIVAFQLNGASDGMMLDGLPGM